LIRLHADDVQRWLGLLAGAARADALRERHEEDWYRNPRAVEELRDEARRPAATESAGAVIDAGLDALAARLARAWR
jgi:hypothetical protein